MKTYGKHTVSWKDAAAVAYQIRFKSLTQGPKIQEFEYAITEITGAKYAVAVSSATAGLHISLAALALPKGSRVATSAISFLSSANAALYCGLRPIFIDIVPETINLSPQGFLSATTLESDISAVIPVHFAGLPCDMEVIQKEASSRGIRVIEDAAHALGASYQDGTPVGSCKYSDLTVFSFHPVKSVTTGEGGVVTTNSPELYEKLLQLRSHGINSKGSSKQNDLLKFTQGVKNPWYYEMEQLGFHYRLTEIQAALGISQLKKLSRFVSLRKRLANNYDVLLQNIDGVRPIQISGRAASAHHIYVIRIDFTKFDVSRAFLMSELSKKGVGTQVHYRPIPSHLYYSQLGYGLTNLPESMCYYSECLTLPIYPRLRRRDQERVVLILSQILEKYSIPE